MHGVSGVTESKVKNLPASVKARLANLARERKGDFQEMLSRYGRERLLIPTSEYQAFYPQKDHCCCLLNGRAA